MRFSRSTTISAAVAVAMLGAGIAVASIPDSGTGVFTACVNTNKQFLSDHRTVYMIDKQAGESCATGYVEKQWNQAGPAGPPGPAGAQGEVGPTGPQGEPAGLGNFKTYIMGVYQAVPAGTHQEIQVFCEQTAESESVDRALSGGASQINTGGPNNDPPSLVLMHSYPAGSGSVNSYGWGIRMQNIGTESATFKATVLCLDVDGDHAF